MPSTRQIMKEIMENEPTWETTTVSDPHNEIVVVSFKEGTPTVLTPCSVAEWLANQSRDDRLNIEDVHIWYYDEENGDWYA